MHMQRNHVTLTVRFPVELFSLLAWDFAVVPGSCILLYCVYHVIRAVQDKGYLGTTAFAVLYLDCARFYSVCFHIANCQFNCAV